MAARTCTPAAAAAFVLRAMPPAARNQFVHPIPIQYGIPAREPSFDMELAQDLLKKAKKRGEDMRRAIKWFSRVTRAGEWACYFGVSYTVASVVMDRKA